MPNPYRFLALLLLFAFSASLVSFAWTAGSSRPEVATAPELLPTAYANPVDITVADTLHAGETLSELLLRAQLAEGDARTLLDELQQYQDPRRMRPGSVIAFRRALEDGAVRRMELRLDADRTLNLLRDGDGWTGVVEEVAVQVDTVVLTGVIESSLYRALVNSDLVDVPAEERERLVDQLADRIFAWQIDFSRDLRSGDQFRILYERLVRPDGTARSGRVLGAQFSINSRDYEAYAFDPGEGSEDYYDREGESLRRAFLRAPLQYRRISSAFSTGRFHPVLQVNRPHNGIDYAAAAGTPIFAVGDGTITRAGNGGSYGNVVDISHTRGYMTRYAHMQRFAPGIRAGVRVKQGDLIGYVGSTGLATGPHLHYEFHQNGRPVNPNSISNITGDPVPRTYTAQFLERVFENIEILNRFSVPVLAADANPTNPAAFGD
jgi:murein DD-endopeptidase MepM/ murein hydrolase activator NlpD